MSRIQLGVFPPAQGVSGVLGTVLVFLIGLLVGLNSVERSPAASANVDGPASAFGPSSSLASLVTKEAWVPRSSVATAEPLAPMPEAPKQQSAREFLADWYGDQWPEIERKMLTSRHTRLDLDIPYFFHPWEEAAAVIEPAITVPDLEGHAWNKARWPQETTLEFIQSEFKLDKPYAIDESDLTIIDGLIAAKQSEILGLSIDYFQQVDAILKQRFRTGDVLKAPFTTAGLSDAQGFYSTSSAALGWAVTITLQRDDYPELKAQNELVSRLCEERDVIVTRYLRTKVVG
jgi:hypothetical protein